MTLSPLPYWTDDSPDTSYNWMNDYSQRFKLQRLRFIADRAEGDQRLAACRDLLTELKRSGDATQLSKTLTWIEEQVLTASLSIDIEMERKICEDMEITNIKRCEQLETELSRVKLTSNKVIVICIQ